MSALSDAKLHLDKAKEFLEAAELVNDLDLFNAATSAAVTSGINAKDAICLATTGVTNRSDNHTRAKRELSHSGPIGEDLAASFGRLLALKTKSQYQTASITAENAGDAVRWATKMYEGAQRALTG